MPEVAAVMKTFRFDQIAVQVKDKVHPDDANVDRYVGLEHIDPESLKIRRWGEPSDVESTKILFKSGDIIFGKRRAYQRKLAVADFDGICSAHAMVLRPKTDVVLKDFLPFFMQTDTFMERAVKISVGGLSPTINWRDLAREEFILPPLDEQRRIVQLLQAMEVQKMAFEEVLFAVERAYSSMIDSLIASIIPEVELLYQQGIGEHPNTAGLVDVTKITDCKHRTPDIVEKGVPMVAPGDIRWGPLQLDKCKRIREDELSEFMDHVDIHPGDLVFSRNQSFGIASYVSDETPFALGQDTVVIQPKRYCSEYVYLALRSLFVQRQILRYAAGSTFGRINLGDVKRLRLPAADIRTQEKAKTIWALGEKSIADARKRYEASRSIGRRILNAVLLLREDAA